MSFHVRKEPHLIGVTGGIAAGKTAFLGIVGALGERTLDCDAVVHGLYAPGSPLVAAICRRWGAGMKNADGTIDRQALATRVFADAEQLQELNRLVHPEVRQVIHDTLARAETRLFCAVPLLFEVGWQSDMDCIIAVWCDAETQYARLSRRGLSAIDMEQRLKRQMTMDEKLELADFGVANNGFRSILERQALRLLPRLPE